MGKLKGDNPTFRALARLRMGWLRGCTLDAVVGETIRVLHYSIDEDVH